MTQPAPPAEDPWARRTLDGLERKNLWVVALAAAAGLYFFGGEIALNVLGAGFLGALNLRALRRTVESLLGGRVNPSRWFAIASGIRFFFFLNLLIVVILFVPISLPAFVAGLSSIVGAAFAEGIHQALRPFEEQTPS